MDIDPMIVALAKERRDRIPADLLEKRLQKGGCRCEDLDRHGICKHCACINVGASREE